jgi:sugar phosphate permease
MFDGMQYIGQSIVGWGMGSLLDHLGRGAWCSSMLGFALLGAILMLFLWSAKPKAGGGH